MAVQEHQDENWLDPSMSPAKRHEQVERMAVPVFDWVSEPIVSMAEGLCGAAHPSTPGRRHHWRHRAGGQPPADVTDPRP